MLFLYGLVEPGAGSFNVSWLEADTAALGGEHQTQRSSWKSIYMEDRLLYMGIVPKGGAKGWIVSQADNRTNNDMQTPSLTFTRLEVWKSTGQIEPADGSGYAMIHVSFMSNTDRDNFSCSSSTIGSLSNTAAPTSSMSSTSSS